MSEYNWKPHHQGIAYFLNLTFNIRQNTLPAMSQTHRIWAVWAKVDQEL